MPKFGFFESVTVLKCSWSEKVRAAQLVWTQGVRAQVKAGAV
jgi:hypothetical protein